jgi:hypothetical protein
MSILSLLVVAVPALQAQGVDAGAAAPSELRVPLEYRGFRSFEFELPDEVFAPVGDGFPIAHAGGERFAARLDGQNLLVDVLGDGSFKAKIEPPPAGTTVNVTLRGKAVDGSPVNYAARVRMGPGGFEYASSGALVGNVGATKIVLVDQDLDGVNGEPGEDALVVGRGRVALPMSRVVMLDDGSLFDATLDGTTLVLRPYTGAVGSLDMLSKFETRAKLITLQVAGDDDVYLDLARAQADATGGVKVPVGSYVLEHAVLALGDQRVTISNGRMAPIEVAADATVTPEWGGPLTAEFIRNEVAGTFTFVPDEVWYRGRGGEEYSQWSPRGASPRFVIVEAETGVEVASGIFAGS